MLKVPWNALKLQQHAQCLCKQSRCLHKRLALDGWTILLTWRALLMHLQQGTFLCLWVKGARGLLLQSHHVTPVFDAYRDFQGKSLQTLSQDQICLLTLSVITSLWWHFLSLWWGLLQSPAAWWVKTSAWVVVSVWQHKSQAEPSILVVLKQA